MRTKAAWGGFGALLLGYPALLLLGGPYALWFDVAVFVTVIALSTGGCIAAARRAERFERRLWTVLVGVNVFTFVGQVYAGWYMAAVDTAGVPIPGITDLTSLLAAGCLISLIVGLFSTRRWHVPQAIRHLLDAAAIAVIVYLGIGIWYVHPLYSGTALGYSASIWISAAYPLMGVITLLSVSLVVLDFRAARWTPWERSIGSAMIVYAFGLLLWPAFRLLSDYGEPNGWAIGYALVFLSGHYLLFVAATYRLGSAEGWSMRAAAPVVGGHHRNLAIVAPVVFTLAAVVFGAIAALPSDHTDIRLASGLGGLLLALLLATRSAALAFENSALQLSVVTDPLTGLPDSRELDEQLMARVDDARHHGESLALIFLNIDGFGRFNTRLGPRRADELLRSVGSALIAFARNEAMVFRTGGDEFAVMVPATIAEDALMLAERIRAGIADLPTDCSRRLTASIGVAGFPQDALSAGELLECAVSAGRWAKAHGPDMVSRYDVSYGMSSEARLAEHKAPARDLATLRALATAVDNRDTWRQSHARTVARLCILLAEELGLDDIRIARLQLAGELHDVGKIGVPETILGKRGALNPVERRQVNEHSRLSERILRRTPMDDVAPWVLHHHERWDGTGYPAGLAGDQIPLESRIIAICDAYEAMTSDRPYRSALSPAAALQEIDLNMGSQFAPVEAEIFIRMISRMESGRSRRANPELFS